VLNKPLNPTSDNAFWLIYLLASAAVIYALVQLANLMAWQDEQRRKRERCPHGVEGGRTQLRCEVCETEEEAARQEREEENRRAKAVRNFESDAKALRYSEHARLSELRTHELDYLLNLSPEEFETAVAAMYRAFGFAVKQTPVSNDFGRDLILVKGGKSTFVECKRYARDKLT
jgi:restriction system protein